VRAAALAKTTDDPAKVLLTPRQFSFPRKQEEGPSALAQTSLAGLAGLAPPAVREAARYSRHQWKPMEWGNRKPLNLAQTEPTPAI